MPYISLSPFTIKRKKGNLRNDERCSSAHIATILCHGFSIASLNDGGS
jgi:hypothetical protein